MNRWNVFLCVDTSHNHTSKNSWTVTLKSTIIQGSETTNTEQLRCLQYSRNIQWCNSQLKARRGVGGGGAGGGQPERPARVNCYGQSISLTQAYPARLPSGNRYRNDRSARCPPRVGRRCRSVCGRCCRAGVRAPRWGSCPGSGWCRRPHRGERSPWWCVPSCRTRRTSRWCCRRWRWSSAGRRPRARAGRPWGSGRRTPRFPTRGRAPSAPWPGDGNQTRRLLKKSGEGRASDGSDASCVLGKKKSLMFGAIWKVFVKTKRFNDKTWRDAVSQAVGLKIRHFKKKVPDSSFFSRSSWRRN